MSPGGYEDRVKYPLVWIPEEESWGTVVQTGAHVSLVIYFKNGIKFQEYFENDELIDRKEVNILYYDE